MEAIFDNDTNLLNANIRATHDNSTIYTATTSFGFWGQKLVTILKDANPLRDELPTVGAINWKERYFEVNAYRRPLSEIRRKESISIKSVVDGFEKWDMTRTRYWKWSSAGREYEIRFAKNEWQVLHGELDDKTTVATLSVSFRPHLIRKIKPALLSLSRSALDSDEVFLILALIYSEAKRQENSNFGPAAGAGAW